MRVLQINTIDINGGAAKVAYSLTKNLRQKNIDVNYLVGKKYSHDTFVKSLPRNTVSDFLEKLTGKDFDYFLKDMLVNIAGMDNFGYDDEILNDNWFKSADIIHLHNLHGYYFKFGVLRKMANIKPIVWTLHDEWAIMPHGAWSDYFDKKDKFYKRKNLMSYPPMLFNNENYLMRRKKDIYKKINPIIVTPSLWLKRRVEKSVLGDKTIKLIPNGIDTSIYKSQDKMKLRGKLKLPIDKKIILFLASGGKDNPQKGWEHIKKIIDNFSCENYLFLCIGGSNKEISREGNILYVPYIKDERKLSEYYSASDVFLFTSNHENFPLTTLEAMGSGLPVIAFDVGGVSEQIINGKNGFIIKMSDYSSAGKCLSKLLNDQELLKNMSKEASEYINNNYSLDKMVDGYMKLYESLIK